MLFSGTRPTDFGLQLGNYLGAIRNWVELQNKVDKALFCVVDLHALTTDCNSIGEKSLYVAATYLACGIDHSKSTIFIQSHVLYHAQLAWILSCFTPMGWLNRMTQFKDKAGTNPNLGLYAYPTLMASDILLYHATMVPVGDDQKQHVELARDIAGFFNRHYKIEHFPLPEPLILKDSPRIMSLKDGLKKMSKSDPSDYSRINLTDDADTIQKKIKKAKTDAFAIDDSLSKMQERPEALNLLRIYAALSDIAIEQVIEQFAGQNFSSLKKELIDLLVTDITPIGEKITYWLKNRDELQKILQQGANDANAIAEKNWKKVSNILGLVGAVGIEPTTR